jgi:DNA-binding Xre family transcriptional regulator
MHSTYVGDAERAERNVSLDNILKLAKALEIQPGELLDGLQERIKLPR